MDHDTRRRFLLLWPPAEKKCPQHDLPQHDDRRNGLLPGSVISRSDAPRSSHSQCSGSSGDTPLPSAILRAHILAISVSSAVYFYCVGEAHIRAGYFALRNVENQPSIGSARVPAIVFCVFQLMFAAITCVCSSASPLPSLNLCSFS